MGVTTTPPTLTGTQLARRKAAADRRERIRATGRRVDLMLPGPSSLALDRLALDGETATATIVRLILQADAKARRR